MRIGQIIDERFELERSIGQGGMGQVFRAMDRQRGRRVALKTMTLLDPAAADRFTREAMLLAELQHPGIVRYIAHGRFEDEPYLVMEWLEGEDLEARLQRVTQRLSRPPRPPNRDLATVVDGVAGGRDATNAPHTAKSEMPPGATSGSDANPVPAERAATRHALYSPPALNVADTFAIARRIAGALAELHRRGIVHRDVKPSNILLVDGLPEQAKLLDFGAARATGSLLRLTGAGMLIGTPSYMSPEQAEGSLDPSPATDVWGLGCVLYESLAGKPPFEAVHALALLASIIGDEPTPLSALRTDLPPGLASLVERMLRKSSEQRFANGQEVVDALLLIEGSIDAPSSAPGSVRNPLSLSEPARSIAPQRRSTNPSLTTNESRVISLLLARNDDAAAAPSADDRQRFEAAVAGSGCELLPLSDGRGSLLVKTRTARAPKEQAANLAKAALRLQRLAPQLSLFLTTGRAQPEGHIPVGEVVDHAVSQLLRVPAGQICLDGASCALLGTRFLVERTAQGDCLIGERGTEEARTLLGKPTPWVGRQRELNLLQNTFEECRNDNVARVLLVIARAGVGKTRLRSEFIAVLKQQRVALEIVYCQGDSLSAGSPFMMLGPAVRRLAQILDGEPLAQRQEKLRARIASTVLPKDAANTAAFIGEMVGVPFDDAKNEALRAARKDPMLLGEQMKASFVAWLREECRAHPVLLVLDDLHWGDLPSVQYIDAALASLRESPLMVLALARPEVHTTYPGLWQQRELQELKLHGLSKRASSELVRHTLGENVEPQTVEAIVAKAEGNAFYLEELIRFAKEGRLGEVPENVLGMVQTRLDGLDQEARLALRAGSIFGEVFWADGVRALVGEQVSSFNVAEWLEHLSQIEVVRPREASRLPAQQEFQFRHALVRDAAYEMLTEEDRVLGHRLAGHWLLSNGEQDPLTLAEHFSRGQETAAAIVWFRRAAEQAFDGNDLSAVKTSCERAIALGAEGETLGALRALESQAAYWKSEYAEAKVCGERAVSLLNAGQDDWFRALGSAIVSAARAGDTASVAAFFEKAMQTECFPGAEAAQLICLCRGTFQLIFNGQFDKADVALQRIANIAGDMSGLDALTVAQVHHVQGVRAAHLGNVPTFLRHLEAAVSAFARAGDTRNVSLERTTVAWCYAEIGEALRARELCETNLAYCQRLGAPQAITYAKVNLGYILALCPNELNRARQLLSEAVAECQAVQNPRLEGWARAHLASVEHLAGHHSDEERHARVATARLSAAPGLQAWALACQARALLACGKAAAALTLAEQALNTLKELGGLLQGEALPPLVYAECLYALGKPTEALTAINYAVQRLQRRAARLTDPCSQQAFLRLPDNMRTAQLYTEWSARG